MPAWTRDGARRSLPSFFLALALLLGGCSNTPRVTPFSRAPSAPAEPLPLERVVLEERPTLLLVTRDGDPKPAIAFVARHGRGGASSAALLGLLSARLEALGLRGLDARPHGLGFEISALVDGPSDLKRFFAAVRRALAAPVRADEPAIARARRELSTLGALRFAGKGETAVAECSGELGIEQATELDLGKDEGIEQLEAVRSACFRVDAAAFAVLGSGELLSDAPSALSDSGEWPTGSADPDPWPDGDVTFVDRERGKRQLSVALRLSNTDAAVGVGVVLGRDDSELLARLRNLTPPWQLQRASAIARRRGACLRLDLSPPQGDPGPTGAEVGRVATLVEIGAHSAFEMAEPGALDESVLRPSDPRRAAVLAAWRALPSEPPETAPMRRTIAYVAAPGDSVSGADLERALSESRARLERPSLETRERLEPGQGELWMLLASPCGTASEAFSDAGALALVLRALARGAGEGAVRFEPWITPDGVGLLAHGPRRSPTEPATSHAVRVAGALGRTLTSRLNGVELGGARVDLLNDLGGRPFAGFAMALEGLSPRHPSWLEPRGLWQSVSELPTESLERARRGLLASRLRLSILSQASEQAPAAAAQLESWLLPWRAEPRACPNVRSEAARRGEARVEVRSDSGFEGAYVGIALGASGARSARVAQISAVILNRARGRLERALAGLGPGTSARAHALGGSRRPVLLIEVRALPERLSDAVNRVRSVLDQLALGSVTKEELWYASRELARVEARGRFDPRRRIVELWHGASIPEIEIGALQAAHSGFGQAVHWVVSVAPG